MTYFVTGASGFVGRRVCHNLISSGAQVRTLVRRPDGDLSRIGVDVLVGDLWEADLLARAIGDAEVIIHCAGDARFGNGPAYRRNNVELTERLLAAVRKAPGRVRRFVFVSTIGAIDRGKADDCRALLTEDSRSFPTSDYGRSKLEAEEAVRRSGLPFVIVRPTMVVGSEMRADSHFAVFARQALAGAAFMRVEWPGEFSVVHVDDLAEAIHLLATHEGAVGRTFFCAGDPVAVGAFARYCRPEALRVPIGAMAFALRPFARWMPFSLKAMLYPALAASDAPLRALGWQPRHPGIGALDDVVARERARLDPDRSPGGQTVVTGAASGLGRAVAMGLASTRDRLLLVDKDEASLMRVAAQVPHARTRVVDLASEEAIEDLLRSPEWNALPVTELYACAGIGLRGRMQEITIERHRAMFAVNVLARLALAHHSVDAMQRRHFGRVVLISSSSAFQPLPYMSTYAATNSALLTLGEAWANEVAPEGVHIMTVCPGGMTTNFQRSGGVKAVEGENLMAPEDVAVAIMEGVRKGKQTLIVSFRSFAMSMLARVLPRRVSVALWGRLMQHMR